LTSFVDAVNEADQSLETSAVTDTGSEPEHVRPQTDAPLALTSAARADIRPRIEIDGRFYLEQSRARLVSQRAFDLVLTGLSLIITLPLFLAIAALIKLDTRGPVFFRQERVGWHRQRFQMWKFRKMYEGLKSPGPMVTVRHDRRMTRVGTILERTKLDELPQLINVLNGTMSMVGPRPDVPQFMDCYPDDWDIVLSVKPGIFGASQNYFRNESELYPPSNVEEFYVENILPKMLELDSEYARHPSLIKDAWILVQGALTSLFGAVTSQTVVMRRAQVANTLAIFVLAIGAMVGALAATGHFWSLPETRRAVVLAAVANPLVMLLLRIPKAVATSMTYSDLRRLLWSAVATTAVIAVEMWAFHDLHQFGLTLVLYATFFLTALFIYKLSVYSFYLTFFVQDSRVFARRVVLASMALAPLSVLVTISVHHGPAAWLGDDRGRHVTMLVASLLVRPLVALHFRPEPLHPGNSSRFRTELIRLVLATLTGSSTLLLAISLVSTQPAWIDLVLDASIFIVLITLFAKRESAPFAQRNGAVAEEMDTRSRILVVGSGIELLAYISSLDGIPEHDFVIEGVVTPDPGRRLSTVGGHPVLGDPRDLPAILDSIEVDQLVVLVSSLDLVRRAQVERVAQDHKCDYFPVRLFPGERTVGLSPAWRKGASSGGRVFKGAGRVRDVLSVRPES
jgi:lipopolysaccharide/colanic/teichoic acid biosynthesis glycosyltransferase